MNGTTNAISLPNKIEEAPMDGKQYVRVNGTWKEIETKKEDNIKITAIYFDNRMEDPESKVIRIIDRGGIEAIRENSHRYTGEEDSYGIMQLKQLDDLDGTKYADGTTANLTTLGLDVWMKLPNFWYKSEAVLDGYKLYVAYGGKPDDTYKEWDGKELIGVYKAFVNSGLLYSVSGKSATGNVTKTNFKKYARLRGNKYSLVRWSHHSMMTMLFYIYYNTVNFKVVGAGDGNRTTGMTNSYGMQDSSNATASQPLNFWGLESWWNFLWEFMDDVEINSYYDLLLNYTWDSTTKTRTIGNFQPNDVWCIGIKWGEECDALLNNSYDMGASETTGVLAYHYNNPSIGDLCRSSTDGTNFRALANLGCVNKNGTHYNYGTRLAYRGEINIQL